MDLPTFITFMVMWMLLLFGTLVIFLSYRNSRRLIDLNHQERMSALERGLEVPPRLEPAELDRASRSAHYRQRGWIYSLLGASLMAALGFNVNAASALWGLPLTAVGIAYLILNGSAARQEKRS